MKLNDVYLAGIGTAATGQVDTAVAVARGWYDVEERERSGLLSVSVAGATPAPDLAVEAAGYALKQSGCEPAEIGVLLHSNVHPQGPEGWSAQHYINRHTINQPVMSVEIHNGCVGFFSSLYLAACYLNAGPGRLAALLTCADNVGTPAVDRWRMSKAFVAADGGGAVVLSKRPGFAKVLGVASAANPELEMRHRSGESLFPPGATVGGTFNFEERFSYHRRKVAEGAVKPMGDFRDVVFSAVDKALADAGTSLDRIARVVHDGFNRGYLRDVFLGPLGVAEERGIWEFTRRVGHAGPTDQIRGLEHIWRNRDVGVGDQVMLVSSAPGVEAACAVLEITETP